MLVAIQFALALTVLIGAGLLVQSIRRVASVDLGFERDGVVSFSVRPPRGKYDAPQQAAALYQRILSAVNAVPSVEASAAAGGALLRTKVETDAQRGTATALEAFYHPVSTDYFRIRRIGIASGRAFTDDAYDTWWTDRVKEIHGFDLRGPGAAFPKVTLVHEWKAPGVS